MKVYFSLFAICLALPLAAYQTGPSGRANFGPAQQSTNAANRWSQGVQTKPVQTSLAGSSATEFKAPVVGKRAVQAPKPANKPATKPTQPSSTTVAMPANADPAAMMQQVQGMMQNMQAITGGTPGAQPPVTGQQGATTNIPGMPDMSALMGGALPAAPAVAPAKK